MAKDNTSHNENDAVESLHDVEAEAGDDTEISDLYTLDKTEARELDVDLDQVADDEAQLD